MAAPKLNESQKRYKILFEDHVSIIKGQVIIVDKAFERRIKELRALGRERILKKEYDDLMSISPFKLFMLEYKFPNTMAEFLYHFVVEDEIDYTLIKSGLYIASDLDETLRGDNDTDEHRAYLDEYGEISEDADRFASMELKLVLNHDTSYKQASDFLRRNWKFVEQRQALWKQSTDRKGNTIRPHLNSKRDYRVMELLEQGLNSAQISTQIEKEYPGYAPTYMAIAQIKSRIKKSKLDI